MTDRVKRRLESLKVDAFPICTEKLAIVMKTYQDNAGKPVIIQRALAQANYLDSKTIFIEPDELIIGNFAAKPMGMEASLLGPTWPDDDLDSLLSEGMVSLDAEDRKTLRAYDDYWDNKGRTKDEMQGSFYDSDRIWNFISRGFLCPAWKDKKAGRGQGAAGHGGWGIGLGCGTLFTPDFKKIINTGFEAVIKECEDELENLRYYDGDAVEKGIYLRAALIVLPAVLRLTDRYSKLAREMAEKEDDPQRKKELLEISDICSRVPRYPARTFREALQSFFFYWSMTAIGTSPGGRFDQFMYPFYKADIEAGRITRNETLELLELLRLKIMQYNEVYGGAQQRAKWAGMARWHNFILGGTDSEGNDITNDITYLMLEAAKQTQTPHNTLTIRVHDGTPSELMVKALEVVRTGMGMPAFISEESYRNFVMSMGVPFNKANEFAIAGCLDVTLPGNSKNNAFGMFIVPCVLEIALFAGKDPSTGILQGVKTKNFEDFEDFDEFYAAFLLQLKHCMGLVCEEHNVLQWVSQHYPDIIFSIFAEDGVKSGKDVLSRTLLLDNSSAINMVGIVNTINSLTSIKKLVFEDKIVTAKQLTDAINADWRGYEDIRRLCLESPKFGNNDAFVDEIAARLYEDYAKLVSGFTNYFGEKLVPSGISITAHAPGGSYTGATPDGRLAGEAFADGSTSPAQGTDRNGPLAVLQSAMKLNQDGFMATLMNMKFTPSTLKTQDDLEKLGSMIKTYLTNGGKHIQFNVADRATLLAAKEDRRKYRDLIVRVAGYSSYFVVLTPKVQDEIIARTEHVL